MTASTLRRGAPHAARPAEPSHLFAIGDVVRLKGRFAMPPSAAEIFKITATLPPRDNSLQYRIRNDEERHERVASEDSLEILERPAQG